MTNDTPPQAEFVSSREARAREARKLLSKAYRDNGDLGAAKYVAAGHDLIPDTQIALLAISDALALAAAPPQAIERSAGDGWAFDEDAGDITFGNAPVFKVYIADDFPCIEDEDRAKEDAWFKAQAQTAVLMLNSLFHDAGDQTPIPDPLATRSPIGEREREQIARIIFDASPDRFMRPSQCYPAADAILAVIDAKGDRE